MPNYFDANWIDVGSLLGGLLYAALRWRRAPNGRRFVSKATGVDVANGASLFPLVLLGLSFISTPLLNALMSANRLILSVAGLAALFAILEDWDAPQG